MGKNLVGGPGPVHERPEFRVAVAQPPRSVVGRDFRVLPRNTGARHADVAFAPAAERHDSLVDGHLTTAGGVGDDEARGRRAHFKTGVVAEVRDLQRFTAREIKAETAFGRSRAAPRVENLPAGPRVELMHDLRVGYFHAEVEELAARWNLVSDSGQLAPCTVDDFGAIQRVAAEFGEHVVSDVDKPEKPFDARSAREWIAAAVRLHGERHPGLWRRPFVEHEAAAPPREPVLGLRPSSGLELLDATGDVSQIDGLYCARCYQHRFGRRQIGGSASDDLVGSFGEGQLCRARELMQRLIALRDGDVRACVGEEFHDHCGRAECNVRRGNLNRACRGEIPRESHGLIRCRAKAQPCDVQASRWYEIVRLPPPFRQARRLSTPWFPAGVVRRRVSPARSAALRRLRPR